MRRPGQEEPLPQIRKPSACSGVLGLLTEMQRAALAVPATKNTHRQRLVERGRCADVDSTVLLLLRANRLAILGVVSVGHALVGVGSTIVADHRRVDLWARSFDGLG